MGCDVRATSSVRSHRSVSIHRWPKLERPSRLTLGSQGGIGENVPIPTLRKLHGIPAPVQVFLGSSKEGLGVRLVSGREHHKRGGEVIFG